VVRHVRAREVRVRIEAVVARRGKRHPEVRFAGLYLPVEGRSRPRQRSSGHIMHGLTGTDAAPVVGSSRMISQ